MRVNRGFGLGKGWLYGQKTILINIKAILPKPGRREPCYQQEKERKSAWQ